jgi:hypothetical protein
MRLDFIQDFAKGIDLDEVRGAFGWRTKGTSQIAYASNLYIKFLEFFHIVTLLSGLNYHE